MSIDPQLEQRIRAKELWTINETADFLGVCRETIRQRVAAGSLSAIRPAREIKIPAGAIVNYLEKRAS